MAAEYWYGHSRHIHDTGTRSGHFPSALTWTIIFLLPLSGLLSLLTQGFKIKHSQSKVQLVDLIYCPLTFGFEVKKDYLGGTSVWLTVYFFDSLANIY